MSYDFLQHYWWFLISLLAAILVFLLFVQGANSMAFSLSRPSDRKSSSEPKNMEGSASLEPNPHLIFNSTGRKWELTFTTLVTFGGAFFASFPLFYSTSFGGAYWLWMIILFSFVLHAVSYEFQNKYGNLLGNRCFQWFLIANGIIGPLLLGVAVATFFNGSNFIISRDNMLYATANNLLDTEFNPVISSWANSSHGLDALCNPWNLILGFAVLFLSRLLGALYIINNVNSPAINAKARKLLIANLIPFLLLFVAFLIHLLLKDGYAYDPKTGLIFISPYKYLTNFLEMPLLILILLIGVVLVLIGIVRSILNKSFCRGIWPAGIGTILTVLALMLCAGWNNTAFYPSNADLQSSLTIANSSSSQFTLSAMAIVSILIPFVLAYIAVSWRALDKNKININNVAQNEPY